MKVAAEILLSQKDAYALKKFAGIFISLSNDTS